MKRVGAPKKRAQYRTTLELKKLIIHRLQLLLPAHGAIWVTTYDVARIIEYTRSSKLQRILDELVVMNRLEVREVEKPGRKPGREYRLKHLTQKQQPGYDQPVRFVKVNGVQMRMPL